MDSLLQYSDQLLFVLLPYGATVVFLLLIAARHFGVPPFGRPRPPAPLPAGPLHQRARLLLGYGLLVVLGGHLLAFLVPEQVLIWNSDSVRLYALEVTGLAFGLMTLVGLILTAAHHLTDGRARQATGLANWVVYALLFLSVGSGIFVALFHPWGSSWYATSVVPYLRSMVKLEPDISYITGMPPAVKLHLVSASVLLAFLPFSTLVQPLIAREEAAGRSPVSGRVTTAVLLAGLAFSLLALVSRLASAHLPGNHRGYEPVQPIAFSHRLHAGEMQITCLYCHHEAEAGPHAGIPAASICMNCHRSVTTTGEERRAAFELAKQEEKRAVPVLGASTVGLLASPLGQGPPLAASAVIPGRTERRPIRTTVSAELEKLYEALGLNDKLQSDPARPAVPIRWVKVHNLPAYTHFDHRAHVSAGVECQHCHGPVETMERVRQVEDLSMGWCVQCHRDVNRDGVAGKPVHASNDCTTCHH
jgi:nitrate reductase gamma subunit